MTFNRLKITLFVLTIVSIGTFFFLPSLIQNGSYRREREAVLDRRRGTCYPISISSTSTKTIDKFCIVSGDYLYIDCDLNFKFISDSEKLDFLFGTFDFDIYSDQYCFKFSNQNPFRGGFYEVEFQFNDIKYSLALHNTANYQIDNCKLCE